MKRHPTLELAEVVRLLRAGGYLIDSPWHTKMYWLYGPPSSSQHAVIADVHQKSVDKLIAEYGLKAGEPSPAVLEARRRGARGGMGGFGDVRSVHTLPAVAAGQATIELTDEQRDTIRHSLGLTSCSNVGKKKPKPYRNYYCTEDGDPKLERLVTLGLMRRANTLNDGRDRYYVVTEIGAEAVGSHLPEDRR